MQAQSSIHHNHFSLKLFHPYNKFITECVFSISLNPLIVFGQMFVQFFGQVLGEISGQVFGQVHGPILDQIS